MDIKIIERTNEPLEEYHDIPIEVKVDTHFKVETVENGLEGIKLVEEEIESPYIKDYRQIPDHDPTTWEAQWDITNWGIFLVFVASRCIGGATIVWNTPNFEMMNDRTDVAVLLDIRVHPVYQERGIGSALFDRILNWLEVRNCRRLKIETQNINVPACRFYAHQGCELGEFSVDAYRDFPNEVQLVWHYNFLLC